MGSRNAPRLTAIGTIVALLFRACFPEPAFSDDGGTTMPAAAAELPEAPEAWTSRAVNTDGGVSVPLLFNGGPGLAFPIAEANVAVRILRSSYPTCRERVIRLFPLVEASLAWKTREAAYCDAAVKSLEAGVAGKDAALARADARAEKLASAVGSSASSTSWWTLFLAFLAGGAIAVGLSHSIKR